MDPTDWTRPLKRNSAPLDPATRAAHLLYLDPAPRVERLRVTLRTGRSYDLHMDAAALKTAHPDAAALLNVIASLCAGKAGLLRSSRLGTAEDHSRRAEDAAALWAAAQAGFDRVRQMDALKAKDPADE